MSTNTMKPSLTTGVPDVHPPQRSYPLRLPSYRSSYLERYHPYGRKAADRKVDFMKTIDLRFDDGVRSTTSLSLSVVEEEDEVDDADLDDYVPEVAPADALTQAEAASPPNKALLVRRRSFSNMILALAFAMRRSLQSIKLRS